jgi:hypothetical protein
MIPEEWSIVFRNNLSAPFRDETANILNPLTIAGRQYRRNNRFARYAAGFLCRPCVVWKGNDR